MRLEPRGNPRQDAKVGEEAKKRRSEAMKRGVYLFLYFIIRMKKSAKSAFILYGKEKVLNKTRNVYVKATANATIKYVKYKGEFVKLKVFAKNKNKKIIVKTIKKDGALFFIYKGLKGLKGLKGGGFFEDTVKFENDIRVPKEDIKDIINKLDDANNGDKYDNICNFVYTYTIRGNTYHIRPSIIIKKGYNIIIKFFFAYDKWRHPQNQELLLWIEIPLHITQFFIDNMIDNRTSKKVSSHIHITSEPPNLLEYNIYAKITKRDTLIDLRHIYLMAGSIRDLILLIRKSNYRIFSNWVKYNIGDINHKHVKFLSFYLYDKKEWKDFSTLARTDIYDTMNPYNTERIPDYNITEGISTDLLDCINTKLYRIIIDIFEYIDETKPVDIMIPYEVPSYIYTHAIVDNITRHFIKDGITHKRTQPRPSKSPKGKENKSPTQRPTQRPTPHSPVKKTTLSKKTSGHTQHTQLHSKLPR